VSHWVNEKKKGEERPDEEGMKKKEEVSRVGQTFFIPASHLSGRGNTGAIGKSATLFFTGTTCNLGT